MLGWNLADAAFCPPLHIFYCLPRAAATATVYGHIHIHDPCLSAPPRWARSDAHLPVYSPSVASPSRGQAVSGGSKASRTPVFPCLPAWLPADPPRNRSGTGHRLSGVQDPFVFLASVNSRAPTGDRAGLRCVTPVTGGGGGEPGRPEPASEGESTRQDRDSTRGAVAREQAHDRIVHGRVNKWSNLDLPRSARQQMRCACARAATAWPRLREEGTSGELDLDTSGTSVSQWLVRDLASNFSQVLLWRPYTHGDLTRIRRIVGVRGTRDGWPIRYPPATGTRMIPAPLLLFHSGSGSWAAVHDRPGIS